ncbi:DNA polymerase V [Pseudoalteromonas ulvae]|uniref:DNA polymerase V n=2 Tax=Pseudoalteromonas ulvae TaxID=107327 RepID=A0A244CR03_PSEDV|nr:DNA recombination protein RmuC [Pseudoalteromonas ulvae]OUL58053.1 DNA polymerase V [Pseudoalteromonas ulvae]
MIVELSFSLLKPYVLTSSITLLGCFGLFIPLLMGRKKQIHALQADLAQSRADIIQYQGNLQQLDYFKDAHHAELQKNQQLQVDITTAKEQLQHFKTRSTEFVQQYQLSQQQLKTVQARFEETHAKLAALESAVTEKELSFSAQLEQIESSKRILTKEFENLANRVLTEKGEAFKALNQESVQSLLQPMQTEMKGFREKVEAIHTEELKQRSELKTELINLQKLNQDITHQAQSLTNALQGQKKVQGNWGELMLENVLDSAGLRLGVDYKREVNFNTQDGKLRPDVIVYLPQNRHIVIDAKTSLNAYTRFVNAQSDMDAQIALKQHALAIGDRINELASKDYFKLPGLNSPEVVVLFVPIESAYVEALKYQPDLYQKAIERNILVATPTTLLTSLNIVKQLWRFEDQSKHTAELANRAERFYTKLNGFLGSMQGVGKQLDKAKESYDKAFSQLYSGRGNLIKQAAEFRDLGVSVQKELPEELTDLAHLELDFVSEESQNQ